MFWPFLYLLFGLTALIASSCLLCRLFRLEGYGIALWLLCLGVFSSSSIVLSATCLGYLSILSPINLLLWQLIQAILLLWICRSQVRSLRQTLARFRRQVSIAWVKLDLLFKCVFYSLLVVVSCICVAAVFGHPGDFDSHGYRLSRIGLWLQEGSLFHVTTTDARMNYLAFDGDLLMLWLTAPFEKNYPLVTSVQSIAGLFTLLSVWSLARLIGFSRWTSLFSVCLMLSMAAFVAQMTTEQVDLLVGAYAVAAVVLFYGGLRLGMHPIAGALALALAIGTKGSMFYFLPGLTLVGIAAIFAERANRQTVLRFICFVMGAILLLAAPRYVENYLAYDNPFAPTEDLERLHDSQSIGGFSTEKLRLNSICYAIQVFGPDSNPFGSFELVRPVGDWLSKFLPEEKDAHSISRSRSSWFESFQNGKTQDEYSLFGSTGALSFSLAFLGLLFAGVRFFRTRDRTAGWVLMIFVCILMYHIFMAGFFKWSPFKFRYYLNIAPFLAVMGAYFFESFKKSRSFKYIMCIGGLVCLLSGFHFFTTGTSSGLGMFDPEPNNLTTQIVKAQRGALGEVLLKKSKLAVSLPYYARLSGFFRNGTNADVTFIDKEALANYASAEAFLKAEGYDAVVTKAMHWNQVGEHVRGIAWNVPGNPSSRDSFEVIRLCAPKEDPVSFVRSVNVNFIPAESKLCYTYTLSGGLPHAELTLINQGEHLTGVSFIDRGTTLTLQASEISPQSLVIDEGNVFGFCFQPLLSASTPQPTILFPLVVARNFRALYQDFTGMSNTVPETTQSD